MEDHLYFQPGEQPSVERAYARKISDYRSWRSMSISLFDAASKLLPSVLEHWENRLGDTDAYRAMSPDVKEQALQLHDTYLMLAGFSIENLLKAAVAKNRSKQLFDESVSTKRLPTVLEKHDLVSLGNECGIQFQGEQSKFLNRLRALLEWAGRYPAPLRSEPDGSKYDPHEVPLSHWRGYYRGDIDTVRQILARVSEQSGIKIPAHMRVAS